MDFLRFLNLNMITLPQLILSFFGAEQSIYSVNTFIAVQLCKLTCIFPHSACLKGKQGPGFLLPRGFLGFHFHSIIYHYVYYKEH